VAEPSVPPTTTPTPANNSPKVPLGQ
jgi:hypothetical protein